MSIFNKNLSFKDSQKPKSDTQEDILDFCWLSIGLPAVKQNKWVFVAKKTTLYYSMGFRNESKDIIIPSKSTNSSSYTHTNS